MSDNLCKYKHSQKASCGIGQKSNFLTITEKQGGSLAFLVYILDPLNSLFESTQAGNILAGDQ